MISLQHTARAAHPSAGQGEQQRMTWLQWLTWPLTAWSLHTWLVLILTLLGLGLRVWFISVNELQPHYSPADDGDYYQRALRFATTGNYIDDFWLIRPPLHVMLFALMIRLSILLGDVPGVLLIRAVQTGMITLTIPVGYSLARRLFNPRAGLIFAAILAVWYPLVELPAHLFSEPTFFFCLLLHLWLLVCWRDTRRWPWLAVAGAVLGLGTLARSPTLYGGAFVLLWLLFDRLQAQYTVGYLTLRIRSWLPALRAALVAALPAMLIFTLSCAVVILPWTYRNYVVYDRFILVDTLSSVNLWLHLEKYEERGVEILKTMPQADRHVFAGEDVRRMFTDDPVAFWQLLWRNAWPHFLHIWKAQFIEDFLTKASFYGRPLREFWVLGVLGDLLWFTFTLGGLIALVSPLRVRTGEAAFRGLALCWVGFTIVAMMIMHIEPRYLLPVWVFLALYAAWLLSEPRTMAGLLWRYKLHGLLALALAGSFLTIFFTYRDYVELAARGIQREVHNAAGLRAYAVGDYESAIRELQPVVEEHPVFVETRANLALAYVAQGDYAAAQEVLGSRDSQRLSVVRGALARAQGNTEQEAEAFTDAETRAGEDAQALALRWLPTPPTAYLELGNGRDLGYVAGFSPGETTQPPPGRPALTYRWLQGAGRVALPLPEPLTATSVLELHMTAGRPGMVPLTVGFVGWSGERYNQVVPVASGEWRVYRLLVPDALVGRQQLDLHLDAPLFIPAHLDAGSIDARPLSLMIHAVRVEP